MERSRIEQIIFDAMHGVNLSLDTSEQIIVAPDAKIYGRDGQLESMGLVALLIDIEEALQDEGHNVTLSDERAMSQSQSPFRDVPSLVSHIEKTLAEKP